MELPRFVVIQSKYNGKYLRYINEDVEVHGHLQFSGEEAVSPLSKFEVQPVKIGEKELVHIRCCYNHHYWQRWSQNHWWIVAGATEPEEDQSIWSCTLFEPIYIDGNARTIRIRHVQLKHHACLWRAGHPYYACLFGGSAEQDRDQCDVYTIIDWESLSTLPSPIAFSSDNGNQGRMELPRYVVIKSNYNGKYLRYINEEGEVHGFLQFSGEEAISPLVKFEVQPVKIGGKDLVHIRCCYNNQYWVSRDRHYIVAGASGPVEERTIRCTLFEPININGNAKTVRFFNVQLQRYACLLRATHPHSSCLCAGSAEQDQDQCDVYTIIDWETLLILPKYIAFKGDNGKYLSARRLRRHPYLCFLKGGHPYLKFVSSDIGDPRVGNEIFTTSDGSVRIKSNYHGKFWRQSPNGIWADSDDSSSDNLDTLFWPVKVDNNVVALRNLGNNYFCKRLTTEGNTGCLSAAIPTITPEAHLRVEELNVISRNIDNVDFCLMGARVYNETAVTMATANAVNKTQETNSLDLKLSYTETKSRTWNSIVTMKLGIKTNLKCGIPLIVDGKIEISGEFSNAYQWGETATSTTIVEPVYNVTVPRMTKATVRLMATKGFCDVPFSYTQRDTLTNGESITYNMDDGLYIGTNYFNFKFENKETPLDGK